MANNIPVRMEDKLALFENLIGRSIFFIFANSHNVKGVIKKVVRGSNKVILHDVIDVGSLGKRVFVHEIYLGWNLAISYRL